MKRATILDVAAAAGVSPATVSNAISGARFVSPHVRERVLKAMAELGYEPNTLARGLRSRRTGAIGVIVPDIVNPFYSSLATAIENMAVEAGYCVVLCLSHYDRETEDAHLRSLVGRQIDGVIIGFAGDNEPAMKYVRRRGVPVVVVDRFTADTSVDLVTSDNRRGGYLAARHLLELNHRHIAYVAGPSAGASPRDRLAGFRDALVEAGGNVRPEWVFHNPNFDFVRTKGIVQQLLDMPDMPSAIFFASDHLALAGLISLKAAGLQVPQDVSIMGFDDVWVSALCTPALTTVKQHIGKMGQEAFTLLLERMTGDGSMERRRIVLDVDLTVRDSCQTVES